MQNALCIPEWYASGILTKALRVMTPSKARSHRTNGQKLLLAMKLTVLLILAFVLQVSAKTYSQNITFSGKEVTLESIFQAVERQTGFVFFYDYQQIRDGLPVT